MWLGHMECDRNDETVFLSNGAYGVFFVSHILHTLLTYTSVRSQTNQPPVSSLIHQRRLKLFGHIARAAASEDRSRALRASRASTYRLHVDCRRPRGWPCQSWLQTIESNLKPRNLGLHSALQRAKDRPSWRRIMETAMLFERATWWWGWCCISIWDWLTENFHVLPRSITPNLPHLSCIKTVTRRFSHSIIELIDRLRNRPWSSVPRGHLLHVGGQVQRLLGCWTDENTASPRGNADNTHKTRRAFNSLLQLHWLPVCWSVQFKLCAIMHCVHNGRAPAYFDDVEQLVNRWMVRPGLRSENSENYYVPQVRTKLGERAFSYAGPVVWNNLPVDIRDEHYAFQEHS